MSKTPDPTPSAGAVRAATEIINAMDEVLNRCGAIIANQSGRIERTAQVIDRETGAGRLAEALERVAQDFITFRKIAAENGFVGTWGLESLENACAALAAWKENNQPS